MTEIEAIVNLFGPPECAEHIGQPVELRYLHGRLQAVPCVLCEKLRTDAVMDADFLRAELADCKGQLRAEAASCASLRRNLAAALKRNKALEA